MTHKFKKFKSSAIAEMNKQITGKAEITNEYGKLPDYKKTKIKFK